MSLLYDRDTKIQCLYNALHYMSCLAADRRPKLTDIKEIYEVPSTRPSPNTRARFGQVAYIAHLNYRDAAPI